MKCACGKVIEVLRSGAGYYLGTMTLEEGYPVPNCRLSDCYYRSREEAQKALETGRFVERLCMENAFCAERAGAYSCLEPVSERREGE